MLAQRHVIRRTSILLTFAAVVGTRCGVAGDLSSRVDFNIGPQQLPSALLKYSEQSGIQVSSSGEIVEGKVTRGVIGKHPARTALEQLLKGTDLRYDVIDDSTVAIRALLTSSTSATPSKSRSVVRIAQANAAAQNADDDGTRLQEVKTTVRIPEVLVTGSRILNMDIRRTEDDAQPYVIFDQAQIAQSGAVNLDEFFRDKLTMNTRASVNGQGLGFPLSVSNINLRGLGTDETLILVDGRRLPSPSIRGQPIQADVNGIPLAAIERIEVLPTTAGGIYGGSATGGVINIVMKREYSGVEAKVTYDSTFESDSRLRRIDLSAGLPLEGGRTQLLIAGSYTDQKDLEARDRDFVQRGRQRIFANNPGFFLNGAPPFGGTTNIRSADGSDLVLKNGAALDSAITYVPPGYSGAASDGGTAFLANAGQYNLELADNHGTTSRGAGGRLGLQAAPTVKSLAASARREFGPNVQAFLEVSAVDNEGSKPVSNVGVAGLFIPESAPNNPFAQDILVRAPVGVPFDAITSNIARRAAAGFILKLPRGWTAAADYTWNITKATESFNLGDSPALLAAVADGSLDLLRDTNTFPVDLASYGPYPAGSTPSPYRTTLKGATLRLAGPIGRLPAGTPILSTSIERREEDFAAAAAAFDFDIFYPRQSQEVDSFYAEIRAPLLKTLELQVAARYDEYTTVGSSFTFSPAETAPRFTNETSSTNPTIALRYQPLPDVALRASYGTGILPPAITQLVPGAPFTGDLEATDPLRGNEQIFGTAFGGGRPDLRPEESESWSVGAILTPAFVPGLRVSLDYSRIDKTDNIAEFPGGLPALLRSESLFPGRIVRSDPEPGDPFAVGRVTLVDMTLFNIARTEVTAWDLQLDYKKATANLGTFEFYLLGTWQPQFATQNLASEPSVENVGNGSGNPLEHKANAGVTWTYRSWTLGWVTRYFSSYSINRDNPQAIVNQGNGGRVDSQIYHNAFAEYRFGPEGPAMLNDTTIQLGVRNVFNTRPPFDADEASVFYSTFGDPRLASYYLSMRHAF